MGLLLILAVYIAALAYGSLLPFNFLYRPLDEATAFLYQSTPPLSTLINNPDFGLNVVLYVPLGVLLVTTLATRCKSQASATPGRFLRALLVVAAVALSLFFSLAIETAQGYTIARRSDLSDVIANVLGGLFGAILAGIYARTVILSVDRIHAGGTDAIKPIAALAVIASAIFSFFPFDFLTSSDDLRAKFASGQVALAMAPSYCQGTALCGVRLAAEAVFAAFLAGIAALLLPRRLRLAEWIAVGAIVGLGIEFLQAFLASGIAQGASIATRVVGFASIGWWTADPRRCGLDFFRQYARAIAAGVFAVAIVAILAVNRIHPPLVLPSESVLTQLGALNWLPFGYLFDVAEAHIALSVTAQGAVYALLAGSLWIGSLGSRPFSVPVAMIVAMLVAASVEMAKLLMPGRHPDPTDVLIAGVACGVALSLLRHIFPNPAPRPVHGALANGNSRLMRGDHLTPSPSDPPLGPSGNATEGAGKSVLTRVVALALFATAALTAISLPRYGSIVAVAMFVAAIVVAVRRDAWLIILPVLLPSLDLTHWTGRLFWTEFDCVCAAMLAALWWRYSPVTETRWTHLPSGLTLLAFGLWTLAAAVAAGWPFPLPVRANLDSYFSAYVGLYSAKGLGWALLFYPFAAQAFAESEDRAKRLFSTGMVGGLALTTLFIIWERHAFPGLINLAHEYRVTGPFSAMHIGGAYVEGYLVGALPFATFLIFYFGPGVRGLAAAALLVASTYALLVTQSRSAYLALAAACIAFALALVLSFRRGRSGKLRYVFAGVALASALATVTITLGSGEAIHQRFAATNADIQLRLDHWARSLRMVETRTAGWAVGIGPGQFASIYFWQPDAVDVPSRFVVESDDRDTFLRIGVGASTYISQFVDVVSDREYTLTARVRASRTPAVFSFPLCEKWLLDSFGCAWTTVTIDTPPGQWASVRRQLDTHGLQHAAPWPGRPVKLTLYNPNQSASVDVTSVSLRDTADRELVGNGTFSAGTDLWFFTTDSHLAWHAKMLPLHVFVELGAVGLLLFGALILRGMLPAGFRAVKGDVFAAAVLASLVGMFTVGLTDSLIDAPRIATMLFLLLEIGALLSRPPSSRVITA
jgi:glycopeptide antibiotics resistance protein